MLLNVPKGGCKNNSIYRMGSLLLAQNRLA